MNNNYTNIYEENIHRLIMVIYNFCIISSKYKGFYEEHYTETSSTTPEPRLHQKCPSTRGELENRFTDFLNIWLTL